MTIANATMTPISALPALRVMCGGISNPNPWSRPNWWERRADLRRIVGGCPDHWWSPVARRTARCTCDRF